MFYLHPDSKEIRANVKLLTAQWQLEVNKLHDAINLIMDSAAYCQVFFNKYMSAQLFIIKIKNVNLKKNLYIIHLGSFR